MTFWFVGNASAGLMPFLQSSANTVHYDALCDALKLTHRKQTIYLKPLP